MKVLVATDSWKGSLSSLEAGQAMLQGVMRVFPDADCKVIPLADGGEGTAEVLSILSNATIISCTTVDALNRPIDASFGFVEDEKVVYMDVATASGLDKLKASERNAMLTSSYGSGILLKEALKLKPSIVVIGMGGSATVDGGIGFLQALGAKVYMKGAGVLSRPACSADLNYIERIDFDEINLGSTRILLACDVDCPLCGPEGAAAIFGPQKGAKPSNVPVLDAGLKHLASLTGADASRGGAAGGIASILGAVLGAEVVSGADVVLDAARFNEELETCDLVITGEGHADGQTLLGKLPAKVLARAKAKGVPVVLIAGGISDKEELLRSGFEQVMATVEGVPEPGDFEKNRARKRIADVVEKTLRFRLKR